MEPTIIYNQSSIIYLSIIYYLLSIFCYISVTYNACMYHLLTIHYLSTHLFIIYLSTYPSIHPPIYLSIHPSLLPSFPSLLPPSTHPSFIHPSLFFYRLSFKSDIEEGLSPMKTIARWQNLWPGISKAQTTRQRPDNLVSRTFPPAIFSDSTFSVVLPVSSCFPMPKLS